jgi:hypothetical protein
MVGENSATTDGRDKPGHDGECGSSAAPHTVMAGPVPAIRSGRVHAHLTTQRRVQIVPSGVLCLNQFDLPPTWPVLDVLFPLDGSQNVLVPLKESQHRDAIASGEPTAGPCPVFPRSANNVVGHASIERTEWPVGHDVHPSSTHAFTVPPTGLTGCQRIANATTDGRDTPGHDGVGGSGRAAFIVMAGRVPAIRSGTHQ